ncbi:HEAT repeat domain-containing protein [Shewanella algae]|uniref:HEAT repeat domain-containing protein n=1 Tax=Shewanella algae TaxID=38313 RepID=UPI001AAD41D0|nr:HEAT repeat domain-containing protein [Shewanella algae]MBO2562627.1 HEAT repeat domain-containing protein [Shewanella algae]MBO2621919.1 HEAT repeat domain-containing protein [Shewanella algae]
MKNLESTMRALEALTTESTFLESAPQILNDLEVNPEHWKKIVEKRLTQLPHSLETKLNDYDVSFWMSINNNRVPIAGGSLDDNYSRDFSLDFNILGIDSCQFSSSSFFHFNEDANAAIASSIYSQVFKVVEGVCIYNEYSLSHRIPEVIGGSDLLNSLTIEGVETKKAYPGDVIVRDRANSIIMFDTKQKCVLLSITPLNYSALFQLNFDVNSKKISTIIDNDVSASRKRKLLNILQSYGNSRSIEVAKQLLEDQHHGIRWQALKVLMNNDEENIEQYLQIGASDTHNEISQTCVRFLKKIQASREVA